MLSITKTDMAFLERDMKSRKQTFGIVAYDILKGGSEVSEVPLPVELQTSYEAAHGDIQALDAKLTLKKNELPASGSGLVGFSSAVLLKVRYIFTLAYRRWAGTFEKGYRIVIDSSLIFSFLSPSRNATIILCFSLFLL